MKKKVKFSNVNLVFEELEPRLLLSADGLAVITEANVATTEELVLGDNEINTLIVQNHTEQSSPVVLTKQHSTELVILDSRVPNFQQLHNDIIRAQQQGRDINVVILDAHRDGLEQIHEALSKYNNLDAVHIVSHGESGKLQLGATQLDKHNLKHRSEEIKQWQAAFVESGDLLLYGCNLAGTSNGQALVNELAKHTATDVAASDDLTGNTILGGDWDLEYQTGDIEASLVFSDNVQQHWQGTLNTPPVITNNDPVINYTENNTPTILFANATVFDSDGLDYKNGSLTVNFSAGDTVNDEFSIVENGTVTLGSSNNIRVNGNLVGDFTGGTGGTPLVIDWDNNTFNADVQVVLQQIAYHNTSDNPDATTRTIDFVLTDGDGGTSATVQQTVNFTAVNDDPPVTANFGLTVAQGATELIPNSILRLSDPDNTAIEVTYTLTTATVNGTLELNGIALALNDTFTQADVNNERLTYVHGNADTNPDSFTFTAADGAGGNLGATTFDITVLTDPPDNDAPVLTMPGAAAIYTANDPATFIDPTATVVDIDSDDFKDGVLTVSISAGGTVNDELSIIQGEITTAVNGNIKVNNKTVGTYTGGTGGTDLVITWSTLATPASVQAILQSIGYYNSSADPSTAPRTIDFVTDDGDGGTSNIAQQTVNFSTPIITSDGGGDTASINVAENTTAVTTVTATDANFDTLTYSITGGADAALFSIDANSGALTFISAPNFEAPTDVGANNIYDVTVQVSDGILIDTQAISVTVTDINDEPTVTNAIIDQAVNEDAAFTFTFAANTFNDIDIGDTLTYTSDAAGWLSFDAATRTFSGTPLNGDVGTTTVTVTADDGNGGSISDTFDIVITNTNDAAVIAGVDTGFVIEDVDPDADTLLETGGALSIVDPDIGESSFVAETITGNYGVLTIDTPGNWSYSADNTQADIQNLAATDTLSDSISVTSFDGTTHNIVITIGGVNDAPTAVNDDIFSVNEGGTAIFKLVDLAANDFDIDNARDLNSIKITAPPPANGSLIVNGDGTVSYTHDGSQTLTDSFSYTISDVSGAISNVAVVNITINSLNNAPTTIGIVDVSVTEDSSATNINLNASFDDADNLDSELTYSITGNTNIGLFSNAAVNAVTAELMLDYAADKNGSSQISIRATDPSGASVTTLFTVTVTPVNDAPALLANTSMAVAGANNTVISNTELNVNDIDNVNTEIVYTVTALPTNGVVLVNGEAATVFTEDDIINNRVSYQSDGAVANDQFEFTVSDGAGGTISGNTFNIVIQLAPPEPEIDPPTIDPGPLPAPVVTGTAVDPEENIQSEASIEVASEREDWYVGNNRTQPPPQQVELTLEPVPQVVEQYDIDYYEEPAKTSEAAKYNLSTASSVADLQVKSIKALWTAVDQIRQQIDNNVMKDMSQLEFRAAAVSGSGVTLTAGVVAWVLRGGALMTSLMGTVPLWKAYDPLPILAYRDDDDEEKNITVDKIPVSLEEMKKIKALKEKMKKHNQVDALFGGPRVVE